MEHIFFLLHKVDYVVQKQNIVPTLLFYQNEPLKNGVTLILPSSIAKNSSAPNAKSIFEIP